MGQCTSRKAKGSLQTRSTFVSHIKPAKMDKPRNFKSTNDEESRRNMTTNENTQLVATKKPQPKYSKGVAMSFGFKRRATPMTTNNCPISRDIENSGTSPNDPNGNKDEPSNFTSRNQAVKDRSTHKQASSPKPPSINTRPSRFGFHQTVTDRTNKVADIKTSPSPVEFGGTFYSANKSRLASPTTETDIFNERRTIITTLETDMSNNKGTGTFTRNKRGTTERLTSPTVETGALNDRRTRTYSRNSSRTETVERLTSPTSEQNMPNYDRRIRAFSRNLSQAETTENLRAITDDNDNTAPTRKEVEVTQIQMGRYTFQTTRLPQPEPIRLIETKTAKTIANNNKRSARIRRQFEKDSMKVEDDSGFSSNTSGYLGDNDYTIKLRHKNTTVDDNRILESVRNHTPNPMENSDSFSETSTPPPLPELPSVFRSINPKSVNIEKQYGYREKYDNKRPFIKLGTQRMFLKTSTPESDSNPHSPSEEEWVNAGEAMAEDTSLLESPKHKACESKDLVQEKFVATRAAVIEAKLPTLAKPQISLEINQNFKTSQKILVLDEDPSFTAVAANNRTGHLLDEEILSPVESLLSCSETEDLLKKKMTHSSSNSKDINEKLTPASPETPSNGTYSLSLSDDKALSLSDDKEDFLIDDEIADQPELVFEDTINNMDNTFIYKQKNNSSITEQDSIRNLRAKAYEIEASPLSSRRRRDFLRSMTGSIDSLSPCESIASDDLMMEYDISQSFDMDNCDRRSGSFSAFDDRSRFRLNSDDMTRTNKNVFKSSSSKPVALSHTPETPNYIKDSPLLLRRKFSYQSSPEHNRTPKKNHQFRYNSVSYDPTSDCLTLTKANHSAIQQDIIGIKTMLLTLKRVLNESETRNSLSNDTQICPYENDIIQNNNNSHEFKVELADLRRQVIFLQGQLEDKEKTVNNLQTQIDNLANNTQITVDTPLISSDTQNKCNAATQTDRIRPISSGSLTLSGSSMDESGSLVSFGIKKVVSEVDHPHIRITPLSSC